MSDSDDRRLFALNVELQVLITTRVAYEAGNAASISRGEGVVYPPLVFLKLADEMRALLIRERRVYEYTGSLKAPVLPRSCK